MFGVNDRLKQLEVENTPIRTSVIGAGSMGLPLIDQVTASPGMEVDIVVDMNIENAINAFKKAGIQENRIVTCGSLADAEKALKNNKKVCTTNPDLAWGIRSILLLVEITGDPASFAYFALNAIMEKKHVVTMNVEGDVCVGHVLKMFADNAGVVYTGVYGDEPGVIKALYDEADALGFEVVAAGRSEFGGGKLEWNKENIVEPLQETSMSLVQQNPALFASFCDGSKTNEECCMVANSTGLVPDVRGMHGPVVSFEEFTEKVPELLQLKKEGGILNRTGVVERIVPPEGSIVNPVWCFVVVRSTNDLQKVMMGMGEKTLATPNRLFFTPYHYVSIQTPISIAYAAIYRQASIAPKGKRRAADVMTMAKKDLQAGEIIDEIGGLCTVGRVEKASIVRRGNFLPFALARGTKLKRDVEKGDFLSYGDVELEKEQALIVQLRRLQDNLFGVL